MSRLKSRVRGRRWLLMAAAIAMFAAVACGTQASSNVSPAPAAAVTASSTATNDGAGTTAATAGGLDESCVQRVLGRAATGFGDITAAERDQVFRECGTGAGGGQDGPQAADGQGFRGGGGRLGGINRECVQDILGDQDGQAGQITQEQRQRIFTECADGSGGDGNGGGAGGPGGGLFGGGGFTGQLPECAIEALGRTPSGFADVSRDELQAIAEACGQDGGFGGFGGGLFGGGGQAGQDGNGGFRGGRGGGFGGFDLTSECVTQTLGRSVTSLAELTPQERTELFQACFQPR